MEIKYTIEILTKDIQDIEKLVGNLRNSKDTSTIELDLALSKLRKVYEILTLIKADRLHELAENPPMQEESFGESAVVAEPEPQAEPQPEAQAELEPMSEPQAELQAEIQAEPEPQAETRAEPEPMPELEPEPQPEAQAEPEPIPEPQAEPQPEVQAEPEPMPELEPEPQPEAQAEPVPEIVSDPSKEDTGSSILAEKFSAESSINENMAEKLGNDADAKLLGKAIDNISRNIGINDRFFIIRELFEGEADRFTSLINELDSAPDFETASNILKQQFADNMDHEGVEILSGLLKRRFIR